MSTATYLAIAVWAQCICLGVTVHTSKEGNNQQCSESLNITSLRGLVSTNEINELFTRLKDRVIATDTVYKASMYLMEDADRDNKLLRSIAERLTWQVGLPLKNAEAFSMTRYRVGQNYGLHYDSSTYDGENSRIFTGIVFLNRVTRGGELVFPISTYEAGSYPTIEKVCAAHDAMKITPEPGLTVFFQNHKRSNQTKSRWGEREPASLHGACPVLKGEKWILQLWMRQEKHNFWDTSHSQV